MSQATPAATPAPASVATSVDTKLGQSQPPHMDAVSWSIDSRRSRMSLTVES